MNKIFYRNAKPYTRWWWFSGKINKEDIRYQLGWLKKNNFGGVEIAWVYPLPGSKSGPKWRSVEWSQLTAYTKEYAASIGLGCDFTLGTCWPFGGSFVSKQDASRTFGGLSSQRLHQSWEEPYSEPGYILNHLDRRALERYASKMGRALKRAMPGKASALFCDSWEVNTEGLWTVGFDKTFEQRFGYDICQYMPNLDQYPHVRYDYRKLIGQLVIEEFYKPLAKFSHGLGAFSRVQCHGAPTDLVAAYASVDVPESEVILFDPGFSRFAASAAALSGKNIVSAEAFTCLYGWKPWPGPGPHQKHENINDLKLLADSLFANGVNFIIWHGMPYNPKGGRNRFYASVHVGPDSCFADQVPAFNKYMERISGFMRKGKTYTDIAVYLPLEDNWMKNELPARLKKPSAKYFWELHYEKMHEELAGYQPLWISSYFLKTAEYKNRRLRIGELEFRSLYINAKYLDEDALKKILRLANQGLPIIIKQNPLQPGFIKAEDYEQKTTPLLSLKNVKKNMGQIKGLRPLVQGKKIPEFWCRTLGKEAYIFFANPQTKGLRYPMEYGQSCCDKTIKSSVRINWQGHRTNITLIFKPRQSLLVKVNNKGKIVYQDIYWENKGA